MRLTAKVSNSDGSEKVLPFPKARYLIRSEPEKLRLLSGKANNLFALSNSYPDKVNSKLSVINKRFFMLEELSVKITENLINLSR